MLAVVVHVRTRALTFPHDIIHMDLMCVCARARAARDADDRVRDDVSQDGSKVN